MSKAIRIRKGSDIRLVGVAEKKLDTAKPSSVFAIKPPDFYGLTPKLVAREGDKVKAGDTIFFDKYNEPVKFNAPVSGTVEEVVRGAKRRILEIRIKADDQSEYKDFGVKDPAQMGADDLKSHLMEGGMWPFFIQRPFNVIANPEKKPKAIFISGFDSSPLATDEAFVIDHLKEDFQLGINALKVLSEGKPVHLGVRKGTSCYKDVEGVIKHDVSGPHPAGNVGVQIHHVDPINRGEVVWTIKPQDIANIGRFLRTGKFDLQRIVALVGSEVNQPQYYRVTVGTDLASMIDGRLKDDEKRIISGNPLTGTKVEENGFLGYYDDQISVLPEGNKPKFFLTEGWLGPGLNNKTLSLSRAYPTWLLGKRRYDLDTNANGEERAFVVTGQYEKVFPFDIYPVQLVKSIIVNDIDSMEKLGIYEVAPEDFALCEYSCTSKINVQQIVRDGLDTIMEEFK